MPGEELRPAGLPPLLPAAGSGIPSTTAGLPALGCRCRRAVQRPPRHGSGCIEWQSIDRGVRVPLNPAVEVEDVLARFVGGGPHIRVWLRVGLQPGQQPVEGTLETVPEVPHLFAGRVLHQSQQVGPGGSQGAAGVVLVEALQLPDQRLSGRLQIPLQVGLRVGVGHVVQPATELARGQRSRVRPSCRSSTGAAGDVAGVSEASMSGKVGRGVARDVAPSLPHAGQERNGTIAREGVLRTLLADL